MEQFADSQCGAGFLPSPLLCGAQGDVKPSMRTAWVLRRDFLRHGFHLRAAVETLLRLCINVISERRKRSHLRPVPMSCLPFGRPNRNPRAWGTVATAEVQGTFMARNTELTELLKPHAQCGRFLGRYPQGKE